MTDDKEITQYQGDVNKYLIHNVLANMSSWMELTSASKLTFIQVTPEKVIKSRKVGSVDIPYVSIDYVERALNFVSNFDWGIEVVREWTKEHTRKVKKKIGNKEEEKDQTVYEACVLARCYIVLDGKKIVRDVYGSWVSYENPAISSYAVMEAARSMATKNFADTLGIGSDRKDKENTALRKAREQANIIEINEEDDAPVDMEDEFKNFTRKPRAAGARATSRRQGGASQQAS